MNQTVNDLTVTGKIIFPDGTFLESSYASLFSNFLNFSRNSATGTTTLLSDFLVVGNKIQSPTITSDVFTGAAIRYVNDLDEDGNVQVQTSSFTNALRDKILNLQAVQDVLIPDIIDPPLKKAKLNEAAFENANFATSIIPNNITCESKVDSSMISLEPGYIYLRNANADVATILTDINGDLNLSVSDGIIKSQVALDMSNQDITNVNTITASNLNGTASQVQISSDNTAGTYFIPFAKLPSSGSKSLFIDDTTTNLTYNPSTGTLSIANLTASSITGNVNGSITGNAAQVTATSDNTSGTYYIPFTKVSGTGSKSLFIDDTTGPLSYNPSTSTLTCTNFSGIATNATNVNVVATNTTNGTYYPVFASAASGNTPMRTDTALSYNPATDTFVASNGNFATVNTPVVQNTTGNLDLRVSTTINGGVGGALILTGGTGILSTSAGGNSGQHLVLSINGTTYKIALLSN
jgi:hypothetical protein